MFDRKKFKALLVLKGFTVGMVAKELGVNEATLYRKMNGESDFYRNEIQTICDLLEIDNPGDIFFTQKLA